MTNKQMISKLKDNAELAQAAYGYFDLIGKRFKNDEKKYGDKVDKPITLHDILDITYKDYETQDSTFSNTLKLKGDFAPTQAKRFFDKYDLLDFYPKFDTKNNKQQEGFHTCLFGEKKLQSHSETKEKSYTNYTLAIRGSFDSKDYVEADFWHLLINSTIPFDYYNDMLNFYEQCIEKYPNLKQSKSLNIVGHSLGGALAQMLTLSLCDDTNEANINEVYTFNSHLESKKAV